MGCPAGDRGIPIDTAPKYLIRDRDDTYGEAFRLELLTLGIEYVLPAERSPWQYSYVERLLGTNRRECLDHIIVLSERHLYRVLKRSFDYYHQCRTHLSLERNSPIPREVEPPEDSRVVAEPHLGGLHHRYRWVA